MSLPHEQCEHLASRTKRLLTETRPKQVLYGTVLLAYVTLSGTTSPNPLPLCQNAGIRVRMVTGDNPETARAIAQESGILQGGTVVTGAVFRSLLEEEQVAAARNLDVMARAEPMDKLLLVKALQKTGAVVAVTGDGTNDAPALKHADVGLAMGIAGTEVAREASDIILLDDSFASITSAVWWGRSLYENIQRFILFQLTINFCACILFFIAPMLRISRAVHCYPDSLDQPYHGYDCRFCSLFRSAT